MDGTGGIEGSTRGPRGPKKVISYHQVITVRNWALMITSKLTMKIVVEGTIIQATVDIQVIDAINHLS